MKSLSFGITIISAHHRGIHLAHRLSQVYKNVAYLDASPCWKNIQKSDKEGPFGFFMNQNMEQLQQEWWKSFWTPSVGGFAVLSDDIFLHFKEFFLSSVYQKRKDYQIIQNYLKGNPSRSNKFKENWLIYLAHLTSSIETPLTTTPQFSTRFLNLFDDFGNISFDATPQELLNKNVYYQKLDVLDYQLQTRKTDHLLLNDNFMLQTKLIIWMLTPFETLKLNQNLHSLLFKETVFPSWYWHRFAFEFDFENHPFPSSFTCVSPLNVPWDYERLMCIKRNPRFKNRLNVWIKLPFIQNQNDSHRLDFKNIKQNIQKQLNKIFPGFTCQYKESSDQKYPILFPIYEQKHLRKLYPIKKHLLLHAWDLHDMSWNGWADQENQAFKKVLELSQG